MKNKLVLFVLIVIVGFIGFRILNGDTPVEERKEDVVVMDEGSNSEEMSSIEYIDINPAEAKALIDEEEDLVIIDVSPHYNTAHLPNAVNYYLGDGSLDEAIPNLDKSKVYLVYCHVDSVSIAGANKLIEAGFQNVYRLEGNYNAWIEAGYPIETVSN